MENETVTASSATGTVRAVNVYLGPALPVGVTVGRRVTDAALLAIVDEE